MHDQRIRVNLPDPICVLVYFCSHHLYSNNCLERDRGDTEECMPANLLLEYQVAYNALFPFVKDILYVQVSTSYQIIIPNTLFVHHPEF